MYIAHDVQPEPARVLDRHAAALASCPASTSITCTRTRSSRSPRRKHCEKLTQEIFGGEMAYVPWMRPGFELGLAMQEIAQKQPEGAGDHDGPARLHLLGRRRQGLLHRHARLHREGRGLHRGEVRGQGRRRRRRSAARSTRRSPKRSATRRFAAILPWLRGQVSPAEALHRHRAGRREDPALRELARTRRVSPSSARRCPDHFLRTKIKPLYVAWNPQTERRRRR